MPYKPRTPIDANGKEIKVGSHVKCSTNDDLLGVVTDYAIRGGDAGQDHPMPVGVYVAYRSGGKGCHGFSEYQITVVPPMYPETKESIQRHRDESIASCIEGFYQDWYDNGPPDKERYVMEYIEDACDLYAKSLVDDPEKFAALQRRAQADRVGAK